MARRLQYLPAADPFSHPTVREMALALAASIDGPQQMSLAILDQLQVSDPHLHDVLDEVLPEYCARILRTYPPHQPRGAA